MSLSAALPAAVAALSVAASMVVLAQQQPTFKSGTQIVSLFVTVVDASGRLQPGLVQEDFEVFDNDKPQPIVFFDNSIRPITVVTMLDTSASMTSSIDLLKRAAEQFLIRLLPDDKGRIGAFNDKIQMNSHFTSDRDALVTHLGDLDYGNSTRLWDAAIAGLDELKGIDGRRVLLLFTDGDDTDSKTGFGTIVERARADETMVYAIGLESNFFNGQRMQRTRPDRGLKRLADETGGGYFELEKTNDLAPTFTRVATELHSQYVIGFAPTQLDNRVHKLAVKMKQSGLSARARRSYVAAPDKFNVSEK